MHRRCEQYPIYKCFEAVFLFSTDDMADCITPGSCNCVFCRISSYSIADNIPNCYSIKKHILFASAFVRCILYLVFGSETLLVFLCFNRYNYLIFYDYEVLFFMENHPKILAFVATVLRNSIDRKTACCSLL